METKAEVARQRAAGAAAAAWAEADAAEAAEAARADAATAAGTREYALAADCLYVEAVTCGGRLLGRGDFRGAQRTPDVSGRPMRFYVRGGFLGLDPKPTGAETLKVWYVRRPPMDG